MTMTAYELCDAINEQLNEQGLNLDQKLSILSSMIIGLIRSHIDNPTQKQIHINTICDTLRAHIGEPQH